MTLVSKNSDFFPKVPDFFDDFLTRDLFNWDTNMSSISTNNIPSANIQELNDAFLIELAVPGLNPEDLNVELENHELTVSCEKQTEHKQDEGRYISRGFNYQMFKRTFHLAKNIVDESAIKAKCENGVLRLHIPKKEEAKALPPRTIQIE